MKKYFLYGLLLLAGGVAFVSCDDDDDDDVSKAKDTSSSTSTTTDDDTDNLLLSKVYSYDTNLSFTYDEQGRCTYAGDEDEYFIMSYDPFSIADWSDVDEDGDREYCTFSGSLNADGYVSEWGEAWSYYSNNGSWTESSEATLSYSDEGRIDSLKNTFTLGTYPGNSYVDFIYENGCLMKYASAYLEYEEGKIIQKVEIVYYEYGDTPNKYRQYTYSQASSMECGYESLYMAGLYGKASDYLPTKITEIETELDDYGNEITDTEVKTITYTLNSNGSVATETVNGTETYTYTYVK